MVDGSQFRVQMMLPDLILSRSSGSICGKPRCVATNLPQIEHFCKTQLDILVCFVRSLLSPWIS